MSKESAMAILTGPTPAPPPVLTGDSPGLASSEPPKTEAPTLESTRFAHLAKKESELVKSRQQIKEDRERLQQERELFTEAANKIKHLEGLKKTDKKAALKFMLQEASFDDTDIFNFLTEAQEIQEDPATKAQKAAQAEINKFKEEQKREKEESTKSQHNAVLTKFRSDISDHLDSDKDKYEYCNYNGASAQELIYETVASVLEETKEIISVEEAADMVENYYEETYKAMSQLKKATPREAAEKAKEQIEQLRAEVSPRPSKTLNSRLAPGTATATTKRETPGEKRERLMNALRNMGKK